MHLHDARGAFWCVEDGAGDAAAVPVDHGSLQLADQQRIRFHDPAGGVLERVSFTAARTSEIARLEIRRPDASDHWLRISIHPGALTRVEAFRVIDGVPDIRIAGGERAGVPANPYAPFNVRLDVGAAGCGVYLDNQLLLSVVEPGSPPTSLLVGASGGDWSLSQFAARMQGAMAPLSDDLAGVQPVGPGKSLRTTAQLALLAWLTLLLYLRALCLGRPSFGALHRATIAALALPALCLSAAWFYPGKAAEWAALLALVPGLLVGLFLLRHHLTGAGQGRLRPIVVIATCVTIAVVATASYRHSDAQRLIGPERESAALDGIDFARPYLPSASATFPELVLDTHNELALSGQYRDFHLAADVIMPATAALEIRTRSQGGPEGVALILSADPSLRSGFYQETFEEFAPLPELAGRPVPADRPVHLELDVVARRFTASLDGAPFASAECARFPRGSLRLLAAAGPVTLQNIVVEPHSARVADVPGTAGPVLRSSMIPVLMILLLSLLASRLARTSWLRALEAQAFALLPFSVALVAMQFTGVSKAQIALGSAATILVLLFQPMVQGRRLSTAGNVFVLLAVIGIVPWALGAVAHREVPPVLASALNDRLHHMGPADWQGERLSRQWLHLQHPLLRRFNNYLIDHRLRDQRHQLQAAPGTKRILAVGSSSTYGYSLPGPGLDWPTQLGRRLADDDHHQVEVLNAGVCGSTGIRLFHLVRNALLSFRPDVIILSLYYNDSVALSQADEPAYLDAVSDASFARPNPLAALRQRMAWRREHDAFSAILRPEHRVEDAAVTWARIAGQDTTTPPTRFTDVLQRFARLAREHGIALVLVKEAIADDGPRFWKQEFRAAMDQVAAEYALPVVDPSPALAARKLATGQRMFMDEVHLTQAGCEVMAETLRPLVQDILAQLDPAGHTQPASVDFTDQQ